MSASHAVAIGMCSEPRDSLDSEGTWWNWMTFAPERWLKGDPGAAEFRVFFPTVSRFGSNAAASWTNGRARCLVFLRHAVGPGQDYWVVEEHPDFPGRGMLQLDDQETNASATVEMNAERIVAQNSLEGVAKRSSLIVVGNVRTSPDKVLYRGLKLKCPVVMIDSVIVGTAPQGPLRVYNLYGGLPYEGQMLLMLQPGEGGAYELVGFEAGAYAVSEGRIPSLNQSLDSTVASLRRALSKKPGHGKD